MTRDPPFGLALARRFYRHAVRPILHESAPRLRYAAALIGPGSEVLGFDDEISRDHHWGPRLLLFLNAADHRWVGEHLHRVLAERLPPSFEGYSTHFGPADEIGVRLPATAPRGATWSRSTTCEPGRSANSASTRCAPSPRKHG